MCYGFGTHPALGGGVPTVCIVLSPFSFLSPGVLPDPGIEPGSPALAGGFFTTELPGKPLLNAIMMMMNCIQ